MESLTACSQYLDQEKLRIDFESLCMHKKECEINLRTYVKKEIKVVNEKKKKVKEDIYEKCFAEESN